MDENTEEYEGKNSISADLIRGHINTIILRSLYERDKYGYEIRMEINQKSHGQYELKEPTLYSALKRLENQGYIQAYYKRDETSSGGRRKYFRLTESGKEIAEQNCAEWEYSRTVIDSLISDKNFDFSQPAPTPVDFKLLTQVVTKVPSASTENSQAQQTATVQTAELQTAEAQQTATVQTTEQQTAEAQQTATVQTTEQQATKAQQTATVQTAEQQTAEAQQTATVQTAEQQATEAQQTATVQTTEQQATEAQQTATVQTAEQQTTEAQQTSTVQTTEQQAAEAQRTATVQTTEQPVSQQQHTTQQAASSNIYTQQLATDEEQLARRRVHENYLKLVSQTTPFQTERTDEHIPLYTEKSEQERDYKKIIDKLFNNAVANSRAYQQAQPIPAPQPMSAPQPSAQPYQPAAQQQQVQPTTYAYNSYSELDGKAAGDGLKVRTSDEAYAAGSARQATYNKGATLFKCSLIVGVILLLEFTLIMLFRFDLHIAVGYPILVLALGIATVLVCGILFGAHYGYKMRKPTSMRYIFTSCLITVLLLAVIVLFALILKVNWSLITDVLAKVIIPCVIALNIPIFTLSFYLFTK